MERKKLGQYQMRHGLKKHTHSDIHSRLRKIPKVSKSERSKLQEGKNQDLGRDLIIGSAIIIVCIPILYYMVSWFCNHLVIYFK